MNWIVSYGWERMFLVSLVIFNKWVYNGSATEYCEGGWLSVFFPIWIGREVIIMETFLEVVREILKGVMRESAAFLFRKNVLEDKKTTLRRHKQKGGSQKSK